MEQDKETIEVEEVPTQEESQRSVELDLNKFGGMEIQQGGSKPFFEKVTRMSIKSAVLKTTPDKVTKQTKDGQDQTYYPVFLALEFAYKDNAEEKVTYENYSGGRLFVSEKEGNRFWVGNDSALGMLITILKENFEFAGTIKEVPSLIRGKEVGVKTEEATVAGKKYQKNRIKAFY